MGSRLSCSFFARDSAEVAEELLGKELMREVEDGVISGTITETEAYYGANDPASRVAQQGRTAMTEIMWEQPGKLFVYMVHGYWLLNLVTEAKGEPGAVLLRSIKPLQGTDMMKDRRGLNNKSKLTDGPGKLTQAIAIDKNFNGKLIGDSKLSITRRKEEVDSRRTGRIGVSDGQDLKLRFIAQEIGN